MAIYGIKNNKSLQETMAKGDIESKINYQASRITRVDSALDGKQDRITISTSAPSGGKDGDIWLVYE